MKINLNFFYVVAFVLISNNVMAQLKTSGDVNKPTSDREMVILEPFTVETTCYEGEQTLKLTEITWKYISPDESSPRIDFTSIKNGFQASLYFSILPTDQEALLKRTKDHLLAEQFDNLTKSVKLHHIELPEDGLSKVQISGLTPGINFYVRICHFNRDSEEWVPSQVIRHKPPVCPFDQAKH